MARNMYTIHSVTSLFFLFLFFNSHQVKAVEGMLLGVCSLIHHHYNLVSVILIVSHPYNNTTLFIQTITKNKP